MEVIRDGNINEGSSTELRVYKALRLITPERAQKVGIPAEAPVFVSPYISEAHRCSVCDKSFTPLVYQVGYTVDSQHFHDENGGIYSSPTLDGSMKHLELNGGFIAVLEPLGKYVEKTVFVPQWEYVDVLHEIRSEGARINGIKAYTYFLKKSEVRNGCLIRDKRNPKILLP